MKRVCLYSMHLVLCVLCVCTMALVLSACYVRNDKQTGVDDRMSDESEPVTAKAVHIERGTSGSENEVTAPLESEKATRKGYNPEMAFNYDEHEDIEVDDNYVASLEDFLVSSLILPIGSLVILLFCTTKHGWGYDNYMNEVNTGKGIGMPKIFKFYLKYILPLVILFIIIDGLI